MNEEEPWSICTGRAGAPLRLTNQITDERAEEVLAAVRGWNDWTIVWELPNLVVLRRKSSFIEIWVRDG